MSQRLHTVCGKLFDFRYFPLDGILSYMVNDHTHVDGVFHDLAYGLSRTYLFIDFCGTVAAHGFAHCQRCWGICLILASTESNSFL